MVRLIFFALNDDQNLMVSEAPRPEGRGFPVRISNFFDIVLRQNGTAAESKARQYADINDGNAGGHVDRHKHR